MTSVFFTPITTTSVPLHAKTNTASSHAITTNTSSNTPPSNTPPCAACRIEDRKMKNRGPIRALASPIFLSIIFLSF